MSIMLPDPFRGVSIEPSLNTARNNLGPAFGGPEQRRNRMGSRYALKVKLEPQTPEQANEWADLDDEVDTCIFAIPQPGLEIGAPGSPLVNGASQAGANIIVDGLTPNYVIRKNQWLTIVTGGQHFCYRARSETVANGSGQATIPLRTMLRKPPANNDPVLIAQPLLEGFVTVDEGSWMIDGNHLLSLSFEIKERE